MKIHSVFSLSFLKSNGFTFVLLIFLLLPKCFDCLHSGVSHGLFCPGLSWEGLIGVDCFYDNDTKAFCADVFPAGTTIKFQCSEFYAPATTNILKEAESENDNVKEWHYAVCLEDKNWSTIGFSSYRCDRVPYEYCGQTWAGFFSAISPYLKPAMMLMCALSVVTNSINLIIFTRMDKEMKHLPILTVLSITDLLFALSVFISMCVERFVAANGKGSFERQIEILISVCPFIFFHVWSTYMIVLAGVCQLLMTTCRKWLVVTVKMVKWSILSTILILGLPYITILLTCRIALVDFNPEPDMNITQLNDVGPDGDDPHPDNENDTSTTETDIPLLSAVTSPSTRQYTIESPFQSWAEELYLTHVTVSKLLPCAVIFFLIMCLIGSLLWKRILRKRASVEYVEMGEPEPEQIANCNKNESQAAPLTENKKDDDDDTTKMLVVLLSIFLLTEFPEGLHNVLNLIGGYTFVADCLVHTSNFVLTLQVVSCFANFIVFVCMIKVFRLELRSILKCLMDRIKAHKGCACTLYMVNKWKLMLHNS